MGTTKHLINVSIHRSSSDGDIPIQFTDHTNRPVYRQVNTVDKKQYSR